MKIFTRLLLLFLPIAAELNGQPPAGIYYQVVAKDAQGNLARNRKIYVRDAIIHKTAIRGPIVYEETHVVESNNEGVFEIIIGKGNALVTGRHNDLSKVDWANGPYFYNIRMAIAPTTAPNWWKADDSYVDMGTTQMMSVPYALYANSSKVGDITKDIPPGGANTFLITDSLGNVSWTTPQAAQVNVTQVTNLNISLSISSGQNVNIAPNTTAVVTVPVPGVKKGDPVWATPQDDYPEWQVYSAWVSSENVVSIRFANYTDTQVTILGSQYKIIVIK